MDNIKNIVGGGIITLVIGGTAFSFTQQDVIDNMVSDTGMTQQQAEQYINNISEDELVSWNEIGTSFLEESRLSNSLANDIDCDNFKYEWETPTLTCSGGKAQLQKIASIEKSLGQAYINLDSDTATADDIQQVIKYLDQLDVAYEHEFGLVIFGSADLEENRMTNAYNRSVLTAALESAE